jgi:hypothetical protein
MVSLQKAQTGARVYLGARTSPNRGQVSAQGAQGYIQRELNKKRQMGPIAPVGADGRSDRRSAVAARSLQRARSKGKDTGGLKPPIGPNGPGVTTGGPKDPNNPPGNPGGPVGGNNGGGVVPQVQVNDEGLLELPYNQDFSMEQYQALQDANNQLLGLKVQRDEQNLKFGQQKRDADLAYNQLKSHTLNANAAGGTAFSSMYGTAVANNANQYANQIGDLTAENDSILKNLDLQQTTIQTSLNQQLQELAQQYADQLGGEAGSLGYGTNQQAIGPGTNSSAYNKNSKRKKVTTGGPKRGKSNTRMSRTTAAQKVLQKKARGK